MRKLTKKIIVAVLSLAMVMGVMAIPTLADAPTGDTIGVVGNFNSFNNNDPASVLTRQSDGTYSGTIVIPTGLTSTEIQLLCTPGNWDPKVDYKLDDTSASTGTSSFIELTGAAGTLSLVYNPTTLVLTVTGDVRQTVKTPVTDVVSIVGKGDAFGNWTPASAKPLTKNGDTYTITINNLAAGNYSFKFLQSAAEYRFVYQIAADDNGDVKTAADGGKNDITLKLTKKSNVTFSIKVLATKGGNDFDAALITQFKYVEPVIVPVEEPTTAAEEPTTPAATTAADNKATTAADNKATTAADNKATTAADNKATTAADNKATTAADNKTTTAADDKTTTAADNGGAGAGEAESTTGAGGSSTDVGASDSSVVIFAVLAAVAIMGAAMVFVKKKSQEA